MSNNKPDKKEGLTATAKSKIVADLFGHEQDEAPDERVIVYSPTGRPTKYSSAIVKKTYEYINSCQDQFYNYQKGFGSTDTYERRVMADIPTLDGLALYLNVHRDTVHAWSKKYPSFSDALDTLTAAQKVRLMNRTLSGDYAPLIGKLMLSANHGMKDRIDATSDDKPLPPGTTINNFKNLTDEQLIAIASGGADGTSKKGTSKKK